MFVDISNIQKALSESTLKFWVDAGVQGVIVGIFPPEADIANQQMSMVQKYGLELHAYDFVYFTGDEVEWLNQCWDIAEPFNIKKMWPDFEEEPSKRGLSDAEVAKRVDAVIKASISRGDTGVYSRREYWQRIMGQKPYIGLDEWVAAYRIGELDLTPPTNWPQPLVDGWETVWGWQLYADVDFGGVQCDLSWVKGR